MAISSLVIDTLPEATLEVKAELESVDGVEVHEVQGTKLVVTIEAPSVDASHAIASSFAGIAGVMSVGLVFVSVEDELDEAEASDGGQGGVRQETIGQRESEGD